MSRGSTAFWALFLQILLTHADGVGKLHASTVLPGSLRCRNRARATVLLARAVGRGPWGASKQDHPVPERSCELEAHVLRQSNIVTACRGGGSYDEEVDPEDEDRSGDFSSEARRRGIQSDDGMCSEERDGYDGGGYGRGYASDDGVDPLAELVDQGRQQSIIEELQRMGDSPASSEPPARTGCRRGHSPR
jgi:hypothetical protein